MPITTAELMELRSLLKDRLQLHEKAVGMEYQDRINKLLLRAAYVTIESIIENRFPHVTDTSSK